MTVQENTQYSRVGHMLGTPQYMAPESFRGHVGASPLVDIYALGAVAYFMLTGHEVFESVSLSERVARQLEGVIALPSARLGHALPADLEALVMRCLAFDPAARPSSAEELAAGLDACNLPTWTQAQARAFWLEHKGLLQPARSHAGDTAWSATLAVDLSSRKGPPVA